MLKLARREDCCGCCACAAACPHGAIRMVQDGMGFRYPEIDDSLCVDCGICEKVCAFKPYEQSRLPKAEAIRFPEYLDKSQSGGLGYAIMRKAIQEGMIVYGAAMDDDFVVRHRRVEIMEGLESLRLSKYVQSDMDGISAQVLKDLKDGRKVLFTGTPCQCAGIGSLCEKYRDKLLLADIVCRAVPSPAFWKSFLEESRKRGDLTAVIFRDPSQGWHSTLTRLDYSDHVEHSLDYYFFFINGLINRPCCADCPFEKDHLSDITMGDCWGVENLLPGFADDDCGCSILLAHSSAGETFVLALEGCERRDLSAEKVLASSIKGNKKLAEVVEKCYICKGYAYVNVHFGNDSLRERLKKLLHKLSPTNTKLYRKLSR